MERTKERKRLKKDLHETILLAARDLFLEKGFGATSMRKIAKIVGISPTTIYLYYKDKAAIMFALHQEGFQMLSKQLDTLKLVEDPFQRLKAVGKCYLNFALENPGFYEIMFIMKEPLAHLYTGTGTSKQWVEGEAAYQFLLSVVQDCQKEGYFQHYKYRDLALMVWANIHGLCALKNNGHLDLIAEKIDENLDTSKVMQNGFTLYTRMLEGL